MNPTLARVRLWGTNIAAVSFDPVLGHASFEYEPDFIRSGIQVSPIKMPLGPDVFSFPEISPRSFKGLPGLLADSLPDRFGDALINAWLVRQGRPPDSLNPVERLCCTGRRGMGALEYEPVSHELAQDDDSVLQVAMLSKLAADLMAQREEFDPQIPLVRSADDAFKQLISVGSSVGGARAKAVVAWNRETDEFRPGQVELPQGFEQWIIKLDEEGESKGYGRIEHAYHLMAVAAGIDMSECRLHLEGGRAHFMTRRFDRTPAGDKIHMQTLGAMAHFDFNMPRANSYEQAFEVLRALGLGRGVAEELFRRMAFNVVARNQDDHVKNISFLMDRSGSWRLSPAYDVTYSVGGGPTAYHQMTINGKFEGFGLDDFKACAQMAGLKRGRAEAILEQVGVAVLKWPSFSAVAEIPVHQVERIAKAHRIFLW
jgi:serine/threonine-protein kinase HipA